MLLISKRLSAIIIFINLLRGIGTQFLAVPSSAEELALSSHPAGVNIATANPALLVIRGENPAMGGSFGTWLVNTKASSVRFESRMIGGYGGIQIRYFGIDDLELRTSKPTDNSLASFGAYGVTLETRYAYDFDPLRAGIALRFIRMELHTAISSGLAADVGVLRAVGKQANVGISLLNLGRMSSFQDVAPALPLRILLGGSYRLEGGKVVNTLLLSGEWSSSVSGGILRCASETKWKPVVIRLSTMLSKKVVVLGTGFGLRLGVYRLGYGIQFGSRQLGFPQMLDISIRLP